MRESYRGFMLQAKSAPVSDGSMHEAWISVECNHEEGLTISPVHVSGVYPTAEAAERAAIEQGRKLIDAKMTV